MPCANCGKKLYVEREESYCSNECFVKKNPMTFEVMSIVVLMSLIITLIVVINFGIGLLAMITFLPFWAGVMLFLNHIIEKSIKRGHNGLN